MLTEVGYDRHIVQAGDPDPPALAAVDGSAGLPGTVSLLSGQKAFCDSGGAKNRRNVSFIFI